MDPHRNQQNKDCLFPKSTADFMNYYVCTVSFLASNSWIQICSVNRILLNKFLKEVLSTHSPIWLRFEWNIIFHFRGGGVQAKTENPGSIEKADHTQIFTTNACTFEKDSVQHPWQSGKMHYGTGGPVWIKYQRKDLPYVFKWS